MNAGALISFGKSHPGIGNGYGVVGISVTIGSGKNVGIGGTGFGLGVVISRICLPSCEFSSHCCCTVCCGTGVGQNEYAVPTSDVDEAAANAGAESSVELANANARAGPMLAGGSGVLCRRDCC